MNSERISLLDAAGIGIYVSLTNDPLQGASVFHMVWPEERSRSPSGSDTSPIGSSRLNLS